MSEGIAIDSVRDVEGGARGPRDVFQWYNLSYEVHDKKTNATKQILKDQAGSVISGSMLAVMGPSGAGKSTLLDMLSGRKNVSFSKTGQDALPSLLFNGKPLSVSTLKHMSTYVEQQDALMASMSVRETIDYAARLSLPADVDKSHRVEQMIATLGLGRITNSKIGGVYTRGVSGGEKRRVTLASQLITLPKIIFLDEPTSGLDSAAAFHVMEGIKKLAVENNLIVIATIHQPSSETLELFDGIAYLGLGQMMYFGGLDGAVAHFDSIGYPLPARKNPADYYMSLINTDFLNDEKKARDTTQEFVKGWDSRVNKAEVNQPIVLDGQSSTEKLKRTYRTTMIHQTLVLTERAFKNAYRNLILYWLRLAMYLMLALMMATIWINIGFSQRAIQDRFSALFFAVAFPCFMAVVGIPGYIEDYTMMRRETANGLYSYPAFLIANTLVSLPFIFLIALSFSLVCYWAMDLQSGASQFWLFVLFMFLALYVAESLTILISTAIPIFVVALTLVAFSNGFFMLVQGYFVRKQNLPRFWYYWAHFIDYQKYAFEGLVKNDFDGLYFRCAEPDGGGPCQCFYPPTVSHIDPSECRFSGTDVLDNFDYLDVHIGHWVGVLIAMSCIYRLMVLFFLYFKKK